MRGGPRNLGLLISIDVNKDNEPDRISSDGSKSLIVMRV